MMFTRASLAILGILSFLLLQTNIVASPTVSAGPNDYTRAECSAAGGTWNNNLDGGKCICDSDCKSLTQVRCERSGGAWGVIGVDAGVPQYACDCGSKLYLDLVCTTPCQQSGGQLDGARCVCPNDYAVQGSGADAECVFNGRDAVRSAGDCEVSDSVLGLPTWYRGLDFDGDCNAIITYEDFQEENLAANPIAIIALNISSMIARIAGFIAVAFVIIGGFKYVLSDGDGQRTAEARKTIINALIGAVIAATASIIVDLLVNILGA